MKKLHLLLLTLFIAFSTIAQNEKGYVYLKNGTILKGKYRYSEDLSKLQIESAGNLWIFEANEIDHVTSLRSGAKNEFEEENLKSPFLLRTELGLLIGNSENSQSAPFSFSSVLNYSITSGFSAGAGIGLEFLKETYLPAIVNLEYKFRNSNTAPYVFLKIGYEVPLEDANPIYNYGIQPYYYDIMPWPVPNNVNQDIDPKGGFMINPGVAFQRMYSSGFGMSLAFGYQFHRLSYKGENDYQLDIDYNRLTIKIGIIFK